MPTPDEAIRMLDQNGGTSPAIATGTAGRNVSAAPVSVLSGASMSPSQGPRAMPAARSEASARPQMVAPMAEAQSAPSALKIASFPELVALAAEKRDLLTRAALEADVRLVRIEDGRLEVALERSASRMLINDLSRKLEQWTGRRWHVIVSNEPGSRRSSRRTSCSKASGECAAEADPRVKEVLARFPGAKVVEVRKLAPEPLESHAGGEDPAESSGDDDE